MLGRPSRLVRFPHVEGENRKKESVGFFIFNWLTKVIIEVLVCVVPFRRKIVTTPVGYFSLVLIFCVLTRSLIVKVERIELC